MMVNLHLSLIRRYFFVLCLAGICVARPAYAATEAPKRLFILQEAQGGLVEYSLQDFQIKKVVRLPAEALEEAFQGLGEVRVNRHGQVLIARYSPEQASVPIKYWLWDGEKSRILSYEELSSGADCRHEDSPPAHLLLSADGVSLYWYETRMQVIRELSLSSSTPARGKSCAPSPLM